jgi:hypothetical protein
MFEHDLHYHGSWHMIQPYSSITCLLRIVRRDLEWLVAITAAISVDLTFDKLLHSAWYA